MANGITEENAFGWHNFIRYAVPGYIFLLFFFIGVFLLGGDITTLLGSSPNLMGIILPALFLIAGYPLGTIIYLLYDGVYTGPGGKDSRVHVRYILSKTNSKLEHFEARAIWDFVLLSERDNPLKDRIFFISNIAQTHGAIIIAIAVSIPLSFLSHWLYLTTIQPWNIVRFLVFLLVLSLISLSTVYLYRYYLSYLDRLETCFIGQRRHVKNIDDAIKAFLKARAQIPSNGVK